MRAPLFLMKSNGGQVAAEAAAAQPVNLMLSGLAGGLIAGQHFADATGSPDGSRSTWAAPAPTSA